MFDTENQQYAEENRQPESRRKFDDKITIATYAIVAVLNTAQTALTSYGICLHLPTIVLDANMNRLPQAQHY